MKRPTFLLYVTGLLLISTGVVFAGSTTLTTYYPAPSGNYNKLRLVPWLSSPQPNCSSPNDIGTLFVDNTDTLKYCANGVAWGGVGAWTQSGNNIYPADTASNPNLNVGIGVTNPQAKLDVNGWITPQNNVTTNTNAVGITWFTASPLFYGIYRTAGGWTAPNYQQLELNWEAGIIIDGGNLLGKSGTVLQPNLGNVGIGITANMLEKLHVVGNIYATGQIYVPSDIRFKSNIRPLTGVLAKLDNVRAVTFERNKLGRSLGQPGGKRELGVIAQDLEKEFPELVKTDGPESYRAVDYSRLTVVLLEAVKELKAENMNLKERVYALEKKNHQ